MKNKVFTKTLSLALAALMVLSLSVPAMAADGEGHWADPYVEDAIERGWITGAATDCSAWMTVLKHKKIT